MYTPAVCVLTTVLVSGLSVDSTSYGLSHAPESRLLTNVQTIEAPLTPNAARGIDLRNAVSLVTEEEVIDPAVFDGDSEMHALTVS